MLESVFKGLFDSTQTVIIAPGDFLLCIAVALLLGLFITVCHSLMERCSRSFAATLAILPAVVCVVIMMVNGNVGTGVAVAGAFSLVRFRSAPGSAREIAAIFLAMAVGLVCGMGYLGYAALIAVVLGAAGAIYNRLDMSLGRGNGRYRALSITIPENLDYTDVFTDIFSRYTDKTELIQVKTSNMGSLYKLSYNITLGREKNEKEMIDELRCRNGNLEISISPQESIRGEL